MKARILVAALLLFTSCDAAKEDPRELSELSELSGAESPMRQAAGGHLLTEARPFSCRLVDITAGSGIRFRHVTGGYGAKLLPETMGSGCAFLDFDGDGILDVFFVNGRYWSGHEPAGTAPPTCELYRGRGDGTFEDVTDATHAGITLYGMGVCVADFDSDRDDDIFVTGVDRNVFLRNDAGRFHDVTESAGLTTRTWKDREGKPQPEWATAAGAADVDLDGDIDLLVGNYVQWSRDYEIFTTLDGVTKAFTTPDRYTGLPCRLFLNHGDGTFEDATEPSGLAAYTGKALALAFWDFDEDGYLDVVVANDTRPNFLFLNSGKGTFEEIGLTAGIAYDDTGRARAGMGMDIADYANDGAPGVVIANFSMEPLSLYSWEGRRSFTEEAGRSGIAQATYRSLTFGIRFLDIDLDGVQDLLVVNGHIEPDVQRVFPDQSYAQSPQLFHGRAFGRFEDVSTRAGPDFLVPRVGRGLATGDIDRDGDLDVLMTVREGTPVLFRNDRDSSDPNHYLRIRLHGRGRNTAALGATVRLTSNGVTQTRVVRTGSSYLSQSEMVLTFGLGAATGVERLAIRWPDGAESEVPVERVDRLLDVHEERP